MYTVVRFIIDPARAEQLVEVGNRMNVIDPDVFGGLRARGDGFAADIESSDTWRDHLSEIDGFCEMHGASIRSAVELGATVTFDVAIYPEDLAAQTTFLALTLPPRLLRKVSDVGAGIDLTTYVGQGSGNQTNESEGASTREE